MPRKAKRKSEVEKSNSKTQTEENVSVKRKAVEKKTSERTSEYTIPEDTVPMHSTLSGIAVESFVSKSAVSKSIPKCTVRKNAPKATVPKYTPKATVTKNTQKDKVSKKVPKLIISKAIFPKYYETKATVKSSKAKSIVSKGTDSKRTIPKDAVSKSIPKCTVRKNAPRDTVPKYTPKATVTKNTQKDKVSKKVPKLIISKAIVPKYYKTKATVKSSKAKNIVSKGTDSKRTIPKGTDLQMLVPRGADLKSNLPECAAQNNFENIFAKPKPAPLQVTALKCSSSRSAACKKTISQSTTLKRSSFKNQATKTNKKAALAKTASKSTIKTGPVKTNKNTVNKSSDKAIPVTSIARRMISRRSAAIKADEKIIALQTPKKSVDKAKKKPAARGRALIYRPLSIKAFKKIMTKIHQRIKPVIRQLLQLFCNPKFLLDGHKRYTHYKNLQYELERLYDLVLRIFTHLSKVIPRLEGRYQRWLKKHNLNIPKAKKPRENEINWTYPPQPSIKLIGVLPVIEKKPKVRRRRPQPARLQREALEFWTYMEHFIGDIVPLMKLRNNVRRDIRKTRHISNEENYEELKVMQSTVLQDKYPMIPFLKTDTKMTLHAKTILKQQENDEKIIKKETCSPEMICKLKSMLNSLKSLYGKNSQWLQELFKWVEIEIEKQHVRKLLFSNDEIVTQICDEVLEILYYEKDLTENQRKKVLEYVKIRRKYLIELKRFCKERKNLLPEKHEQNRCTSSSSSMCTECFVTKEEKPGTFRYVCL